MDATDRRYRRKDASTYLEETWGIKRAPSTLAKLATIGGGPRFQSANRIPLYPQEELDAWARGILSPLKASTSDRGQGERVPGGTQDAGGARGSSEYQGARPTPSAVRKVEA